MDDQSITRRRKARWAGAAGLLAAGAIGGGVVAGTLSASAADSTPSASNQSSTSALATSGSRTHGHGGAQRVRGDENAPATARTRRTCRRPTADGTVKFDKNLKVTNVENGMGGGDPAPTGQDQAGISG